MNCARCSSPLLENKPFCPTCGFLNPLVPPPAADPTDAAQLRPMKFAVLNFFLFLLIGFSVSQMAVSSLFFERWGGSTLQWILLVAVPALVLTGGSAAIAHALHKARQPALVLILGAALAAAGTAAQLLMLRSLAAALLAVLLIHAGAALLASGALRRGWKSPGAVILGLGSGLLFTLVTRMVLTPLGGYAPGFLLAAGLAGLFAFIITVFSLVADLGGTQAGRKLPAWVLLLCLLAIWFLALGLALLTGLLASVFRLPIWL